MNSATVSVIMDKVPMIAPKNFREALECCVRYALRSPMPRTTTLGQSDGEYAELRFGRHRTGINQCLDKFKSVITHHLEGATRELCLSQMDLVAASMRETMSLLPNHRLRLDPELCPGVTQEKASLDVTRCLDLALQLTSSLEHVTRNASSIHDERGQLIQKNTLDDTGWTHYAARLTMITGLALINTACLLGVTTAEGVQLQNQESSSDIVFKAVLKEYSKAVSLDGSIELDESMRAYRESVAPDILLKSIKASWGK